MKRFFSLSLVGLMVACFFNASTLLAQSNLKMKIMSYNIRNATGMDNNIDYRRVANVIKKLNPKVVALQEVDSVTKRSNGIDVARHLGGLTKMNVTYSAAIDFDSGKYGVALLSKDKPSNVYRVPLPGSEEPRTLLIVVFKNYVVMVTHWSLTAEDRNTSVDIIKNFATVFEKPILLAGDFNAEPTSLELTKLQKEWQILSPLEPTYPADSPIEIIDYILGYQQNSFDFFVKKALVIDEPMASDHRPIFVESIIRRVKK